MDVCPGVSGGHRHGISNDCRGSHTYEHITKSQGNEIRRNETHLNLGSGLEQGTIKNSRGSQSQDFLNTRGVRADKELACQLRSSFPKKMASILPLHTRQGSTLSLCSMSRASRLRRFDRALTPGVSSGIVLLKNCRGSRRRNFLLNTPGVRP